MTVINQVKNSEDLLAYINGWQPPTIDDAERVPTGDMPGDKVQIEAGHIQKANLIMPSLLERLAMTFSEGDHKRAVVTVHGGSGVGKSETGALLAFYLNELGIGTYVLSGDNYPYRIPMYNDAERQRVFRDGGVKGLVEADLMTKEVKETLFSLWSDETDPAPDMVARYPWLETYQTKGSEALNAYLGSPKEIDFDKINGIIAEFKDGKEALMLKRMGRTEDELWYDQVDFSNKQVLIIEWTHGNNQNLQGIDVPILLNSTPEETLAHRKSRNRDGKTDSAFTTMVLGLEQKKLMNQASDRVIIVTKDCHIIDYDQFRAMMGMGNLGIGPMLNAYPDSIGGTMAEIRCLMDNVAIDGSFESFYILPSIFNTDLDRGFSVIDYNINETYGSTTDFDALKNKGIDLKFDFILNHASVLSEQFQDIVKNGQQSVYADFFINWNKFWDGYGEMTEEGYIQPNPEYIEQMFFRKPGLPILNVRMPDGEEVPYWNTFYQEVRYSEVDPVTLTSTLNMQYSTATAICQMVNSQLATGIKPGDMDFGNYQDYKNVVVAYMESQRRYLGQMDLNIESPLVWEFYEDTLSKLAAYGAKIVRLDAFAYAPKMPGKKNFLNEPDTWDLLAKVKELADQYQLTLLPEIHASYAEGTHRQIAKQGFMTYDFFLPGLLIDAIERQTSSVLSRWMKEIIDENIKTVNMLGCHDGIPLLDLKGLLQDDEIQNLIDTVVGRGGYVKDLHGKKNIYYQVNATYYSALGEDDKKMLLARAVQMFTPGKPQVWYLDLFAGKNDHAAVEAAGPGGHKEINRTNIRLDEAMNKLNEPIVQEQLRLLKFRKESPAFNPKAEITIETPSDSNLIITWRYEGHEAKLEADFATLDYNIIEK